MRRNQKSKSRQTLQRKRAVPPEVDWSPFWQELSAESERTVAIVGAALIDEILAQSLDDFFIDAPETQTVLSSVARDLGDRALLAFVLGLLTRNELKNINLIRQIRNYFAHTLMDASFSNPDIKKLCFHLKVIEAALTQEQRKSARGRFQWVVAMFGLRFTQSFPRQERRLELKPPTNEQIASYLRIPQASSDL